MLYMENFGIIGFMRYSQGSLLDKKFKAISDDTRLKIIVLLKDYPLNAGEIADHFTFSFASISYHLHILEQSGLITSRRLGQHKQYTLNKEALQEIYLWLKKGVLAAE